MAKASQETRASIWKRLFVERANERTLVHDQRPVFLACSVVALVAGVVGWAVASIYTSWLVPVCSVIAILAGLLGVRSRVRTIALLGFVMGMFLLPNAVNTVFALLGG
jgi:hypothetical protein